MRKYMEKYTVPIKPVTDFSGIFGEVASEIKLRPITGGDGALKLWVFTAPWDNITSNEVMTIATDEGMVPASISDAILFRLDQKWYHKVAGSVALLGEIIQKLDEPRQVAVMGSELRLQIFNRPWRKGQRFLLKEGVSD